MAILDDLERLVQLRERGALTDDEFQTAKKQLLRQLSAEITAPGAPHGQPPAAIEVASETDVREQQTTPDRVVMNVPRADAAAVVEQQANMTSQPPSPQPPELNSPIERPLTEGGATSPDQHTHEQRATEQHTTEQHAPEQRATEQHGTESSRRSQQYQQTKQRDVATSSAPGGTKKVRRLVLKVSLWIVAVIAVLFAIRIVVAMGWAAKDALRDVRILAPEPVVVTYDCSDRHANILEYRITVTGLVRNIGSDGYVSLTASVTQGKHEYTRHDRRYLRKNEEWRVEYTFDEPTASGPDVRCHLDATGVR